MGDTIRKVQNRTKDFTIMVNEALRRPDLSARAKGVYAYLMTLPSDWRIVRSELTSHFTEGREAVETAFNELISLGYITKEVIRDKGKFVCFEYTAHESTISQETVYGKPLTGKPLAVNPSLLSTEEELSTKELNTGTPQAVRVSTHSRPTLAEVTDYCKERRNTVNPEAWFDHYTSNGWRVGKNPMKDWRAAVRTWERSGYSNGTGSIESADAERKAVVDRILSRLS